MPKSDIKNQFELIYSEKKEFSVRREFNKGLYPIPELKPEPNFPDV